MKLICTLTFLISLGMLAHAQTISKLTPSTVSGTVCPVSVTQYELTTIPSDLTSCQIDWTATNGVATRDANNQRKVSVVWNDLPGVVGELKATFTL